VVGVAEMLRNDALKIGVDHGSVKRLALADDPVGENPALRPFSDPRQRRLRCLSGSGRRSIPSVMSRSNAT
jgi:hypothetical protein